MQFQNGVSQGDVSIGSQKYTKFPASQPTPGNIAKSTFSWDWQVTAVNGKNIEAATFGSSGSHTVYVLNAAPASPWSTAAGNQLNPWVPVLEYACTWAQGKSQPQAIVATITTGAYNSLGKTYDGNQTRTSLDGQCNLALLLSENVVDCKDMAAVVQLCANAVGVANIQVLRIDGPFAYKPIKPIGHSTWNSGAWNHHMHAWYGSAVYDACIQVRRAAPYVPVADSLNGSYKSNLFDYGTFVPQSPIKATITQ